MAVSTMISRTRAAEGTLAEDIDAANEVIHTVMISAMPNSIPLICAMKMAEIEMNSAVPSIFILHPIGKTKRVIRLSIRNFCSITWNVNGNAAAVEAVANAVSIG